MKRTICPRCGSSNIDWIIPQVWSKWECKDCSYTGPAKTRLIILHAGGCSLEGLALSPGWSAASLPSETGPLWQGRGGEAGQLLRGQRLVTDDPTRRARRGPKGKPALGKPCPPPASRPGPACSRHLNRDGSKKAPLFPSPK